MLPPSLYRYIWLISRNGQIRICLLIAFISPLSAVPLELQRRIVEQAVGDRSVWLLMMLGLAYLGVVLVQGGLKFRLNLAKGRVLEEVTRDLRRRILAREAKLPASPPLPALSPAQSPAAHHRPVHEGTVVSVIAAESEDIGGFASESLAVPLLQIGSIAWVAGYLVWVEPAIAGLAFLVYAPQAVIVPYVQGIINQLARTKTSLVRQLGRDALAAEKRAGIPGIRTRRHAARLVERIFGVRLRIYRRKFFLTFLGNFLDSLGPIIVLVVGGWMVIQERTDISTLVVFISGFQRLSDPWDQLITFYRSVSNARVTYGLVVEALGETRST